MTEMTPKDWQTVTQHLIELAEKLPPTPTTPAPPTDEQRAREWLVTFYGYKADSENRHAGFDGEVYRLAAYAAHVLSQHRPGVQVHPADCGWTDKE